MASTIMQVEFYHLLCSETASINPSPESLLKRKTPPTYKLGGLFLVLLEDRTVISGRWSSLTQSFSYVDGHSIPTSVIKAWAPLPTSLPRSYEELETMVFNTDPSFAKDMFDKVIAEERDHIEMAIKTAIACGVLGFETTFPEYRVCNPNNHSW
ncbi:hypothetical protein [Pseudomonas asuensis]|uniref:hypothetical protein n=1 Tax=Pseudomonas asuensis TaxID=1825787 RepID=UPI001669814C|nr:hypothetical protein [Pseudomonas asuensis]